MYGDTRVLGPFTVIEPRETRIDAQGASVFKSSLAELVAAGHRRILINLGRVSFLDSSGLGAIVSALKRVGPDGQIAVCNLTPAVRQLFELTRLNRVIRVFDSEDRVLAEADAASA
jgi:anti-sigma B factor antagonist